MSWEQITSKFNAAQEVYLILIVALVFLTGGATFIMVLFLSRVLKSYHQKRKTNLCSQYQKILNKIIVNETFSERGNPDSAFEYYMAELRLIINGSAFAKQVLISQILEVKKNLTGNSANSLISAYYSLSLEHQSLRKLKSFAWEKKALAIRELADMGYKNGNNLITPFLHSKNPILREESFMALVRLEEQPLSFLNSYQSNLTLWMRMTIYQYLSKYDPRKLPVFSQWFQHSNVSIVLFSISMARQFRQSSSIPGLVDLLYSNNAKVVGLAITTLGELEAYECRTEITKLASNVWHFEKLAVRVISCLAKIGDMDCDIEFVAKFLSHPIYDVRYEAVKALKKLGPKGAEVLRTFNIDNNRQIEGILRHFSDPLLA